jgi:hypothetical protein
VTTWNVKGKKTTERRSCNSCEVAVASLPCPPKEKEEAKEKGSPREKGDPDLPQEKVAKGKASRKGLAGQEPATTF